MNRTETTALLAIVAAHDRRTTGESEVQAWHDVLDDIALTEARAAVRGHFRDGFGWLTAGEVRNRVRRNRRDAAERREFRDIVARRTTPPPADDGPRDAASDHHRDHVADLHRRMGWAGDDPDANATRHAALAHLCPWCRALPGNPCLRPSRGHRAVAGREPLRGVHPARLRLTVECPMCGADVGKACRHEAQRDRDTHGALYVPPRARPAATPAPTRSTPPGAPVDADRDPQPAFRAKGRHTA